MASRDPGVRFIAPLGFFDFVRLERSAFCVFPTAGRCRRRPASSATDVTLRDVTERPETVECGSNILAGSDPVSICKAVELATCTARSWQPPAEYLMPSVAETVIRVVTGFRTPDLAEREWQTGVRL